MGIFFSSLFNRLYITNKPCRILIFGLDNAGKTSILYRLKLGEFVSAIPTVGFNVETVKHKNLEFTIWDVGGGWAIKPLYRHYYQNTNAVIFVIDSNDGERLNEALEELVSLLSEDELKDAVFLVFANKQDLPKAMGITEIGNKLRHKAYFTHKWFIQECCATNGSGIYEGLEWLSNSLN